MDVVDVLLLQRGEEALHRRVVETVALAAHRLPDAVPLQDLAVGLGSVLDPSVTVVDQAGFRPAALQGHDQRVHAQPGPHSGTTLSKGTGSRRRTVPPFTPPEKLGS